MLSTKTTIFTVTQNPVPNATDQKWLLRKPACRLSANRPPRATSEPYTNVQAFFRPNETSKAKENQTNIIQRKEGRKEETSAPSDQTFTLNSWSLNLILHSKAVISRVIKATVGHSQDLLD